MVRSRFSFRLSVVDEGGALVLREEMRDFAPCYEDLLFSAVRSGALPNDGARPPATAEPVWADGGAPRVAAVDIALPPHGAKRYGPAMVDDHVRAILAARGLLDDEAPARAPTWAWWLDAEPRDEEPGPGGLRPRVSQRPFPLARTPLAELGIAERPTDGDPVAVVIRQDLADALCREAAASLDRERADILTGHLLQAPEGPVTVVVTDRVAALTATAASRSHFAFSPLTFVAAREEAARRQDGTEIVGWSHSHPPVCGGGCLQVVPPCATSSMFFSAQDCAVHRASFPSAFAIALVVGKEANRRADQPGLRAYGWRDGAIAERAFTTFRGGSR